MGKIGALATCAVLLVPAALPLGAADVALVKSADTPSWAPAIETFKRAAAAHTLVEYDLHGDASEAQRVATELKSRAVIVVALGLLAAQTVHGVAPERPLLYAMVPDPHQVGLAGAPNTMGVAFQTPVRNQLAAFRMVNPRAVRIGVLHAAGLQAQVDQAVQASSVLRLRIVPRRVAAEKDVPAALRALLKGADAVEALWLPPEPLLLSDEMRRYLLSETAKAGIPIYTYSPLIVAEGALVSNGPDPVSIGQQLAELLARAAAGERAVKADLRVPSGELVVNRKTADRLKIEIPATALDVASKVY
jgi:ABC-type uncharacterized transport system substrate-binding protein